MADGLSEKRLARIEPVLRRYVDDGELPGYLLSISRRGREALFLSGGLMDVERGRRFERDAIARIYSMTKPIASVALMQLYEQGAFQLDDPVSRYIPGWERLQVFAGGDEHHYGTRAPDRPMIVKDLLTHTSGLTYGFMHSHPVDALYRARISARAIRWRRWWRRSAICRCSSRPARAGSTACPPTWSATWCRCCPASRSTITSPNTSPGRWA